MQITDDNFENKSKSSVRKPSSKFEVDWDLDGEFDDETQRVKRIEVERSTDEPLNGIHLAQFDVLLDNMTRRYTPGNSSPIASYLRINRRSRFFLGFDGQNIPVGKGVSKVPIVNEQSREASIHYFDELEVISNHKLTDGSKLYVDVRTDLYIWDILDEVYRDWFLVLASFDTDETWEGDGIDETVNHRGGDRAIKLESTGSLESAYTDTSIDVSDWQDDDFITMFVYIEDLDKVDTCVVRFHNIVNDAYADLDLLSNGLVTGWNQLRVRKDDVIGIDDLYPPETWFNIEGSEIDGPDVIPGREFDWSDIVRIEVRLMSKKHETFDSPTSVYEDSLDGDWLDSSEDSTVDFSNDEGDVFDGTSQIKWIANSGGKLFFEYDGSGFDIEDRSGIGFAMRGTAEHSIKMIILDDDDNIIGVAHLANYGGNPVNGLWKEYFIRFDDLGISEDTVIKGFYLQDSGGFTQTLYIDDVKFVGKVLTTDFDTVFAIFDELRITDRHFYPERIFDLGLQNIGIAAFGGNTALFEIKSAAESEGARFFADEEGRLHFENRQHYNNDPKYKVSVHEFNFERIMQLENPQSDFDIINSVSVRLKPRVIVDTKVIWSYGYKHLINASQTVEVWASFSDPVPVTDTGLITPVPTTDYTANDNEDGSGSDRTANLDIEITKFTDSAILKITNNHGSPVYVTFFQLRGTPAEQAPEIFIRKRDQSSIDNYGERPVGGASIESKYLTDPVYADALAQQIVDWYKDPIDRIEVEVPALPQLQIGDMITVVNGFSEDTFLMRVSGLKYSFSNSDGLMSSVKARTVSPFELLTFFEIGASEIGGSDVIAP